MSRPRRKWCFLGEKVDALETLHHESKNQVWREVDILDELEDFSTRIEIAARLT